MERDFFFRSQTLFISPSPFDRGVFLFLLYALANKRGALFSSSAARARGRVPEKLSYETKTQRPIERRRWQTLEAPGRSATCWCVCLLLLLSLSVALTLS